MAHWAPLKQDTLDALAAEISQNYGSGYTLVAITGADPEVATSFATDLAGSFGDRPTSVIHVDAPPLPTRADNPDTVFVVTGGLTADKEYFNFTVWLESGHIDRTTRAAASAIVDVTDPGHPRRVFADSC